MHMNKTLAIIIAIVVIGGGAWYFMKGDYAEKKEEMQATSTPEEAVQGIPIPGAVGPEMVAVGGTVTYTDEGFSPSPLTIKVGESVEFKNVSSRETWPASAMHPEHTVYPGTDIKKCGTDDSTQMFDACGGVVPGGSWTFTFNEKGEWGYHDHLNAKYFGKIVVQ